jgi:hypothetical protein
MRRLYRCSLDPHIYLHRRHRLHGRTKLRAEVQGVLHWQQRIQISAAVTCRCALCLRGVLHLRRRFCLLFRSSGLRRKLH